MKDKLPTLTAQDIATSYTKDVRASDGFVKDFPKGSTSVQNAPNISESQFDLFKELYDSDSIVRASIEVTAEESIKNKGYFSGSKSAINSAQELFDRIDFYELAEAHVRGKSLYGNDYVAANYGDDGQLEFHNLETSQIFIGYDAHGKILWYGQNLVHGIDPLNSALTTQNFQKIWMPEDVHFSPLIRLGSRINSIIPLLPAMRALNIRQNAHFYIDSVFKNFRPQTIYSVENNISPDQVKSLAEAIRAADKDPSKKILSVGELKVATSGMYEFNADMVAILNYVRQEVLSVNRTPGSYISITDNSNRGISEMEAAAFQAHLLKMQRGIEKLANWILKKAKINATFKCKPPSIKSQTDIIDQAKKLRDMGYGDETITPFLYENGINIPEEAEFEEENQISMDDYESRQGSGKGVTEGKYKLDENGRSSKGKEKMDSNDKSLRGQFYDL
jgi:hypothetical protein